jgi:hypothetical protein
LVVTAGVLAVIDLFHTLPIQDPWFDLVVFYVFLKILVSGMPEPTIKSSDGYIWMYRSLHMMAMIPSRYFINKSFWHIFEDRESRSPVFREPD